jgi:PAS domain S-box-containing protein
VEWFGAGSDITSRKEAEAALRESAARLRLVVESARDYAIFTIDPEGTVANWYPGAEAVFGYAAEAIQGRNVDILYTPDDRAAGVAAEELEQARTAGTAPDVRWHVCQNGERVFLEGHTTALRDTAGQLTGYLKIGQNITERRRAEAALRESEERFRLFVQNVQEYALFQTDRDGLVTSWNPGAERLFGYTTAEMLGQSMERLLTPEDQQARVLAREKDHVLAGEHAEDARWMVKKDGSRFWAQWVTEPVHDEMGQLRGVAKVLRDETDRKRAEERQQLLIGELNHRVKNTLATVQAMASHTLRSTSDPQEFSTRFQQRLQALSRAHNQLTRSSWEGAEVAEIVREQLELEGHGERVTASGPPAFLDAQSSLALAMVLHELGTNARKYGALSVPDGRLSLSWEIGRENGEARLQLEWTERGGPLVRAPKNSGFGMALIRMSLRGVGGQTDLQFDPEGVRCRLDVPLGSGPGEGLSRKDIRLR